MGAPLVRMNPDALNRISTIESPIDQQKRLLSLRTVLDEQKMNQLKIEEAQRQQADEEAFNRAMQTAGYDKKKLLEIGPQMGVSATRMQKFEQDWADARYKMASATKAENDNLLATQKRVGETFDSIRKLPIIVQPKGWTDAIQQLQGEGLLTPEQAQKYAQYPGPDGIRSLEQQFGMSDQLIKEAQEERAVKTAAATEQHNLEMEKSTDRRDYEYAVAHDGYKGTFVEYQLKQHPPASASEGTWSFAEDKDGNPILFNSKTSATRSATGMQKAGTEKTERDYVIGIDGQGKEVMVPGGEAAKYNLTQVGKAPTNQVVAAQDARQFKQLADKQGDTKKPETMGIKQLIDALDKDGKLGVVSSRMNSFLMGGVGTLPGDDARIAALLNKAQLAMTLSMKAHFGLSGGRSPAMLQHFLDMANAKKMDGPALRAGFAAVDDYMTDRAMLPAVETTSTPKANEHDPLGIL